jgi:hypothetical protein
VLEELELLDELGLVVDDVLVMPEDGLAEEEPEDFWSTVFTSP